MLEVSFEQADAAESMLQNVMLEAADKMLSPFYIPAEADPVRLIYWKKD